MCIIIPTWSRIHRTSPRLDYIYTGPCHVIWFYCCSYTGISINITYLRRYLTYLHNSMCVIIPSWCRVHCTSLGLGYINIGPCHIILFYCCSYTGVSIQHNASASLNDISRQLDVRYKSLSVPYTLDVTRISPYKHWTLSCYMILLLFKYCYK
jgi:hypothetical protein